MELIDIENAIHDTEVMKEYLGYRDEARSEGLGVLIDIAHKYQKIEKIKEEHLKRVKGTTYSEYMIETIGTWDQICKVLEDEKIDW